METLQADFIPLAPLLTKLGVMLAASLLVERFLAMINWLIDRFFVVESTVQWEVVNRIDAKLKLTEQAIEESKILEAHAAVTAADPPDAHEVEVNPLCTDARPDSRFDVKEILPPEQILNSDDRQLALLDQKKIRKEFWMQILGMLVGILGCIQLKFSIFSVIMNGGEPHLWGFIMTGIIIGAGSKPVNFLMNFLINRKVVIARDEIKQAEAQEAQQDTGSPAPVASASVTTPAPKSVTAAAAPQTIEDIVGFRYDGGDRPERLENTHLYTGPIDTIVYHHTAMHSESPFREVVKEFDRKGWLTGYHCVIMKDGTIRVLCRWDRFGNHAKGYNSHSMGIALHGNFETDPKVPFSNDNGQYGILEPTIAQIDSAARIVALWTFLHDLAVAFPQKGDRGFPKGIIPHLAIAAKACPGCNFPHPQFQKRVRYYADLWAKDKPFRKALKEFKTITLKMA